MHHPPLNPNSYCGLTVVTDIGRHDTKQLLDGQAGLFWESCIAPYSRWICDIRSSDESLPLLPGTKVVLHLGEESFKSFRSVSDSEITLNELRGTPIISKNGIINTCSYLPQDAFDRRNYFGENENESSDEENTNEKVSEKSHQNTKRRNYKFWLHSDLRKTVRWVRSGINSASIQPQLQIYPPIKQAIEVLSSFKNEYLYIDIETDKEYNLTCIGFCILNKDFSIKSNILVVPFKRYTRTLAYEEVEIFQFLRALAQAFRDNTVVVWNAVFDLMVLAWKYRIPFPKKIFDGMIAWQRCYPEVEKSLGHAISYLTDLPYHKNEGVFDPHNSYQEQELWNYNGKDIHTLMLCTEALVKTEIPKLKGLSESVVQGNRSIRPYLTMMYKGVRTDTAKLIERFKHLQLQSAACDRVLAIITGRKLNPRSSPQVCTYLYDDLGFEEPPEEPTNEKNLLKLMAGHVNKTGNIIPSVRLIIYARGIKKAASNIKYRQWSNDSGRTYDRLTCSYNIAGTETFRLGSRRLFKWKNDKGTGFGCLLESAEVFTKQGWRSIKDIQLNEEVIQWEPSGNLSWSKVLNKVEYDFDGWMIQADSWFHKQVYTPDHRIPRLCKVTKQLNVEAAKIACRRKEWKLPVSGILHQGCDDTIPVRLIAMVQADGSIEKSGNIRLGFEKQRKIDRCRMLLDAYGIVYNISYDSPRKGMTRFYISAEESYRMTKYFTGETKTFGDWIFKLSYSKRIDFLEEVSFWDATIRGSSFIYLTTNKQNAENIATLAHFTDSSASIVEDIDNNRGYGSGNNKTLYRVNIKPKNKIVCDPLHFSEVRHTGKIYCIQTQSSFFLTRYKNVITVTGNTNCQNRKKDEKVLYIPDNGKIFIKPDQAGAEALIVAYLCRHGNFRNLFVHKIKPHVFVALHLFKSIWEKRLGRSMDCYIKSRIVDLKNQEGWGEVDNMIKESDNWPSDQRYYFIAKQACHSSNYDVKAPTFQINTLLKSEGSVALSLKQCRELLNTYHGLFPEIRYWHSEIINEIKNGRVLRNLFGFPRRFTGPWGDDLFKKGYAFKPQSTVATITNLAVTELQERIDNRDPLLDGVDLLVNEHDGLLTQAPIERAEVVAREILKHMARELESPRGEKFRMGVEVKIGYNWSDAHKVYNPNGLKEVKLC